MADDGSNKNRGSLSSSSKSLLRMTDDDPSVFLSSSVHAVVFNDDLLIEILLRLPVISLVFFKSVSKRWLSLITSPAFVNLRLTRFPNIHSPCGFFLQKPKFRHTYEHEFMSLKKKKKPSAFTFGCFGTDSGNVEILQSCNGLVLCVKRTNPDHKIYVYNPTLDMFKMLPEVDGFKHKRIFDKMKLAFDPAKSPHYKVLHAQRIGLNLIQTRIYSSETSRWERGSITYPTAWFGSNFDKGVYWNDALHWLDVRNLVRHFKLDVEHPPDTTTLLPKTLHWDSYNKLFESSGCLLLACATDPNPKQLEIYEMRDGYSGWSVRYIVNYEDSSLAAFLKIQTMSTVRFCFKVLFIVVGGREEESFIVMEIYGNILKYNFLLKTLHTLCLINTDYLTEFHTFPFIASFASV